MATLYTISLTDLEEKVIQALAAQRSAELGSTVTAAELIQHNASIILRPFIAEFDKLRETQLISGFRAASEVEKEAIEAAVPKEKP